MLGVAVFPAILMLAGLAFVPESPRWLMQHGRIAEATRSYRRIIFSQVGIGGTLGPILATSGIGAINVIATAAAMWLIDRIGRRPLLILGIVPMALSMGVLSVSLRLGEGAAWTHGLAVVCLGIFVTAFAISLGPLPYVLMSETFPQALRGQGVGLASAAAWGVNVLVSATFPPLVASLGIDRVFGLYSLISAAALCFVILMVPETRERTLELIEANLAHGRPVRDLGLPMPPQVIR